MDSEPGMSLGRCKGCCPALSSTVQNAIAMSQALMTPKRAVKTKVNALQRQPTLQAPPTP